MQDHEIQFLRPPHIDQQMRFCIPFRKDQRWSAQLADHFPTAL
jgi:hypothetical protein